jgi:signal transduction histidine kinase
MNEARFRFSKNILLRLGEELNPSPDQSVIELVKNSYDADARTCTIELNNTDQPGGTVRIVDDGDGMDDVTIRDGWLVLGRSLKSNQQRTKLGRIPAGSKGLGRLAALRMGTSVDLLSTPKDKPDTRFRLKINWLDFEKADLVDDVVLSITQAHHMPAYEAGTEIKLCDIHNRISRLDVKRLARSLLLLADPFADNPEGFKPILKAPEFTDLEALVNNRYFKDSEYHLVARTDKTGRAHATVNDWRENVLFSAEHRDLASTDDSIYQCPPAEFDLWVFILDKNTFSTRTSTLTEVREWLKVFGGVHLYQNGLRVNPYGNPGNDWLDINLRRAQSPEERPSTNTSIGRVSILDDANLLVQKTDRSGFIEGPVFLELKKFAQDALEWMAKRRLETAEKRRMDERAEAPKKSDLAKLTVAEAIKSVPRDSQQHLAAAFNKYDRMRDKEITGLRKEVQLYRTLSTAGITATTFAHESAGNPIKIIGQSAKAIERRAKIELGDRYETTLQEPVNLILKSNDALKVLGNVTMNLVDHEKRRLSRIDIHQVIASVVKMFDPFLDNRSVHVDKQFASGNPFFRGSEASVESIITNFLNNSINWFEKIRRTERKIIIQTEVFENRLLRLRFFDNGPGIEGISKKDIWLPGQTTRPNGTGLGLTIVRDAVKDLGGNVDAIEHGELGGAEFIVELPIIGVQ